MHNVKTVSVDHFSNFSHNEAHFFSHPTDNKSCRMTA